MSRWGKSLFVTLPLALALTAGFRFIQHTDREYGFWVATFGDIATQFEARCAASRLPDVCARARDRKAFSDALKAHHGAVMAWWWPVVAAMALVWGAVTVASIAMLHRAWARRIPGGSSGAPGS